MTGPGAAIGVDVGGTKCLAVALDGAGRVIGEHRRPTPRTGPDVVHAVVEVVHALGETVGSGLPVGVGAPGLVADRSVLRFAPNLPGVVELALADLVAAEVRARVTVDNDATCAAWAESRLGAAIGVEHVVMVTLGTGIGGGLVVGGRVERGAHGFAGEFGHMVVDPQGPRCPCGKRGCWERFASGSGLGWMAREAAQAGAAGRVVAIAGGDPEAVRGEHVTAAAGEGDAEAIAVMERFAWWLALGLANLCSVLDPELIVLGGGMVEAGIVLLEPVRSAFTSLLEGAEHRPEVPIRLAHLGERAGAVGAALLAGAGSVSPLGGTRGGELPL